ncbi:MAG: hypothetical protein AAGG50_19800 [Bacteroidota bacterium]
MSDPAVARSAHDHAATLPALAAPDGVHALLTNPDPAGHAPLLDALPAYIRRQRWFGAKDCSIVSVGLADAVRLVETPWLVYLVTLDVTLQPTDGPRRTDAYLLPLTVRTEAEGQALFSIRPQAALAWLDVPDGRHLLYDAAGGPDFWVALFDWWTSGLARDSERGTYAGHADAEVCAHTPTVAKPLTGEQSNSAAILDGAYFLKLYRRLERGPNPEVELLQHLTEAGFAHVPALHGTLTFAEGDQHVSVGVIQQALRVETDGWSYATDLVAAFLDRIADRALPDEPLPHDAWDREPETLPDWLETEAADLVQLSRMLGVRTAEMHLALATGTADALRPEPGIPEAVQGLGDRVTAEMQVTRTMLAEQAPSIADTLPFDLPSGEDWAQVQARLNRLTDVETTREKIRIHGDYHLGQTLIADGDVYLLDFEGEPARSLEERRARDYALRDVAGMLRSLEYAAYATLGPRMSDDHLRAWTDRLVRWCEALFRDAYLGVAGDAHFTQPPSARQPMLWAYLLDKTLYEVRYELGSRPDWAWIPLRGLRRLLQPAPVLMPIATAPATDADG